MERDASIIPINIAVIAVTTITKMVASISSWRVDQETLLSSNFTSFKKITGFWIKFFILIKSFYSGAAGLEPAVTVLETVGLPLTDAPILSLCAACVYDKIYKIY